MDENAKGRRLYWWKVRVYFPADRCLPPLVHEDSILGADREDALRRAWHNWPQAEQIEVLGVDDGR